MSYLDPDTGRRKIEAIPEEYRAPELRVEYAELKRKEIEARKRELERGAARKSGTDIAAAREEWLRQTEDAKTRRARTNATAEFVRFVCEKRRIKTFDDLRQKHLAQYRDHIAKLPHARTTRNRWISSVTVFLKWAIAHESAPFLNLASMKAAMPRFPVSSKPKPPHEHSEVRAVFEAAVRHDQSNPRFAAMPLIVGTILGCMRVEEATLITTDDFLDKAVLDGKRVGRIDIRPEVGKGGESRQIYLDHTPLGARYLRLCKAARDPGDRLLGVSKYWMAADVMQALRAKHGAPKSFSWQKWRRTGDCYLASAPKIFGGAAHTQTSKRLGHNLATMGQYYTTAIEGIAKDATTLEAALGVEDIVRRACDSFASDAPASVVDIDRSMSSRSGASR